MPHWLSSRRANHNRPWVSCMPRLGTNLLGGNNLSLCANCRPAVRRFVGLSGISRPMVPKVLWRRILAGWGRRPLSTRESPSNLLNVKHVVPTLFWERGPCYMAPRRVSAHTHTHTHTLSLTHTHSHTARPACARGGQRREMLLETQTPLRAGPAASRNRETTEKDLPSSASSEQVGAKGGLEGFSLSGCQLPGSAGRWAGEQAMVKSPIEDPYPAS